MAVLEIVPAEFNPALIDPLDQLIYSPDWDGVISGKLPSPAPIKGIAQIANQAAFSAEIDLIPYRPKPRANPNNTLTLKFPIDNQGQVHYELPDQLEQFYEGITLAAGHEHAHYPDRCYKEVALVLDQTPVEANKSQRTAPPSRLGMRNPHRDPHHHAYGVADNGPTLHIESTTPIDANDICSNPEVPLSPDLTVHQANPYEFSQYNPLSLHMSSIFKEAGARTLLLMRYTYLPVVG